MSLLDAAKAIYAEAEHILKTRKQWDIPISRNKLLDLKRSIEEAEKTAAQEIDADPPRKLVRGNVIRDKVTGHKRVVLAPMNLKLYQEFICEQPHQDGDFSYLCQKDYCRCKQ